MRADLVSFANCNPRDVRPPPFGGADRVHGRRRRYPSDLTEHQWQSVEPLLGDDPRRAAGRGTPLREVADAVNYRWSTGCSWRMLPHDFPHWSTVYAHFRRWRRRGVLGEIRVAVLARRRNGEELSVRVALSESRASPPPSPVD